MLTVIIVLALMVLIGYIKFRCSTDDNVNQANREDTEEQESSLPKMINRDQLKVIDRFPVCFVIDCVQYKPARHIIERVTRHFTNPTRVFFKLHYDEAESLWLDAIRPLEYGGSGACEKLAFLGDNILRYHVIEILRRRYPQASAKELASMKEVYLTNMRLNECSMCFHFSNWLQQEKAISSSSSRRRKGRSFQRHGNKPHYQTAGKISATIVEALVAATDQFHQKKFTELCVLALMKIMTCPDKWTCEDHQICEIPCGTPVYTDHSLKFIVGQLTCNPVHSEGICYSCPDPTIAAFNKSLKITR